MENSCNDRRNLVLDALQQGKVAGSSAELKSHVSSCAVCQSAMTHWQEASGYATSGHMDTVFDEVFAQLGKGNIASTVVSNSQSRSSVVLGWILGLAAVAIFSVIIWQPWSPSDHTDLPLDGFPSKDTFLFLDAEQGASGQDVAVLHEMKDFKIVRKLAGDTIASNEITNVRSDGIELKDGAGDTRFWSREDLHGQFSKSVTEEIAVCEALLRSGSCGEEHVLRLMELARLDQVAAVRVLKKVLDSNKDSAIHATIEEFLGDRKNISYLQSFIARLRSPEQRRKSELLESLSQNTNPIARSAIVAIVNDADESVRLRVQAVGALANYNDVYALHSLNEVLHQQNLPTEIRISAELVRDTLLQAIPKK